MIMPAWQLEKTVKKHLKLAALLEERIARGDYALVGFPGVREVALEAGVSIMTAHRAVQQLIRKKVVARRAPGRGKAGTRRRLTKGFTIGIIMPPGATSFVWDWDAQLRAAAAVCGATVREVICHHGNDAMLANALGGFDGVFVFQLLRDLPAHIQKLIKTLGTPLVSLDRDLSAFGIPSILAFPPGCCRPLFDHLHALGHRRIGCLNTFPDDLDIRRRIDEWRKWMNRKGLDGPLINELGNPMEHFQNYSNRAHDIIQDRVNSDRLDATALVCTTIWTALGAMRGLQECGLRVGRDLSIAVVNDEGMSQLVYPTLTAIRMPEVTAHLKKCIRWMMRGGQWRGELRMMPSGSQLFAGQSSGLLSS